MVSSVIAPEPPAGTVLRVNENDIPDDRYTMPLAAQDQIDLVNAASRRSPRMRTMLWAMVSPDGLVRSAFGGRSHVHDAAVKAEAAAFRAGFVCLDEGDASRDDFRTRVERRWRVEYREGIGAIARWAASEGDLALHFLRSLNDPACREDASHLYTALSAEPSLVELLPDRPRWALRDETPGAEWLSSALELLELVVDGT